MSTGKAHPEIDGTNLHDEYDVDNPVSAKSAVEDEIRPVLEDWVFRHAPDNETRRMILTRMYVEWALEHVEQLNRFEEQSMMHEHPYALEAERHLRDIVTHLD